MAKVTVYTMQQCPYCDAAKKLLQGRNIPFEEVRLTETDEAAWNALYRRTQLKTVPQIFSSDRLIGGFNDLAQQDKIDGLKSLR